MKRTFGLKVALNIAICVMVVGGIVFTLGFGVCLYIAREEVYVEANQRVQRDIDYVNTYIDGQLQRIEDVSFALASRVFGHATRRKNGEVKVGIDPKTFVRPTPEECYVFMEQFLEANPDVYGVAFGFEPYVYPDVKSKYCFTPYVSRIESGYRRLNAGDYVDTRTGEWYSVTAKSDQPHWSNPFFDTTHNRVITCFSIPVHGYGDRLVGVLSMVVDTEAFSKKCAEVAPYPNSIVSIVDRDFNFICHPETSYILRNVADISRYAGYEGDDSMKIKMEAGESGSYKINEGNGQAALFYFTPIKRTGWMISIECPFDEVYGGVNKMKVYTTVIAVFSILFMIAIFIWMFRYIERATLANAGMQRELKIASGIQMGMIPKIYPAFPEIRVIDVCGLIKPAKSVGGDLFDYAVHGDKFYFCIGDVSGKGVPASLFMCVITALFRNISIQTDNPASIVEALNRSVADSNEMNMFCTMFVGVLDLQTGHLDYCNAGHNAPIIRRIVDGKIDAHYITPRTNLPIGVIHDFDFEGEETILNPGEAIFLYTDGVTEAEGADKALFGEEATLKALHEARVHSARSAQEFVNAVYEKILEHAKDVEQSDDITMLVVEYRGNVTEN